MIKEMLTRGLVLVGLMTVAQLTIEAIEKKHISKWGITPSLFFQMTILEDLYYDN